MRWLDHDRYRASPLEMMTYTVESAFCHSQTHFDARKIVEEQLRVLYP
jgi:hypothetical protein